ncbi:MAG: hypothetical protein AAF392_00330 [Bacteroidota bacterium]
MYKLYIWIKGLGLVLGFSVLLGSIVWAEKRQATRTCQAIDIAITGIVDQRFVEEQALLTRLTEDYAGPILGTLVRQVVSLKIENSINSHSFVRIGTVYKNWLGSLKIAVLPKRPIARILFPHEQSRYIDEEGELLPLSDQHTARVLLIDGKNLPNLGKDLRDSQYGITLLELLNFVDQDPFWHSQITHVSVDEQGRLILSTQLSKQKVVFGRPENIAKRMKKLKLFYKIILPYKGWNTYKRISLEFENQIVCE